MSNEFQNRLANYEAKPSDKVWPAILNALDEQQDTSAEKLFNYEEKPDPLIWDKIALKLNDSGTGKVVPFYTKYKKVLKYSFAAAVMIAAVAFISFLFSDNEDSPIAITKTSNQPTNTPQSSLSQQKKKPINNLISSDNGEVSANKKQNKATSNIADRAYTIADYTIEKRSPGRYTVIENSKGKAVRLSKKVVSVFNCADSKSNNNLSCKENIQTLQHKMATSSISASADFAGLIDMLKDLKENNN
jgi:hypothetical protein